MAWELYNLARDETLIVTPAARIHRNLLGVEEEEPPSSLEKEPRPEFQQRGPETGDEIALEPCIVHETCVACHSRPPTRIGRVWHPNHHH